MSLLLNTLSMFVIAFLPRSKHLLISWLQSPSEVILKPKKMNCTLFPLSAIRVGSSAYLRLLIFFPAILIPACASKQYLSLTYNSHSEDFFGKDMRLSGYVPYGTAAAFNKWSTCRGHHTVFFLLV